MPHNVTEAAQRIQGEAWLEVVGLESSERARRIASSGVSTWQTHDTTWQ
jgi:hypothetical protein